MKELRIDRFDVLVDDEDFELALLYSAAKPIGKERRFYFYKETGGVPLHRAIFIRQQQAQGARAIGNSSLLDGDFCNLRRENLVPALPRRASKGVRNISPTSSSGFIGVYLNGATSTYSVVVRKEGESYRLGHYGPDPRISAQLYNIAAERVYGGEATLNLIPADAPKVPTKYLKRLRATIKKKGL